MTASFKLTSDRSGKASFAVQQAPFLSHRGAVRQCAGRHRPILTVALAHSFDAPLQWRRGVFSEICLSPPHRHSRSAQQCERSPLSLMRTRKCPHPAASFVEQWSPLPPHQGEQTPSMAQFGFCCANHKRSVARSPTTSSCGLRKLRHHSACFVPTAPSAVQPLVYPSRRVKGHEPSFRARVLLIIHEDPIHRTCA